MNSFSFLVYPFFVFLFPRFSKQVKCSYFHFSDFISPYHTPVLVSKISPTNVACSTCIDIFMFVCVKQIQGTILSFLYLIIRFTPQCIEYIHYKTM